MLIFYTALAILGASFYAFATLLGDLFFEIGIAYNAYDGVDCSTAIGLFFTFLIPTAGIYLANNSPITMTRGVKIAVNVVSFVTMAISFLFFTMFLTGYTDLGPILIPSLLFSYIATTANQFYMAKTSNVSEGGVDESGIVGKAFGIAKRTFAKIGSFKDTHHDAYLIISTIICTLLSILAVALIMFVISLIIGIVMFVVIGSIILGMLNNNDSTDSRSKIYEVWEDGYKRTLTYKEYAYSKGDRYVDDLGDYWITEDNGKTFYREY